MRWWRTAPRQNRNLCTDRNSPYPLPYPLPRAWLRGGFVVEGTVMVSGVSLGLAGLMQRKHKEMTQQPLFLYYVLHSKAPTFLAPKKLRVFFFYCVPFESSFCPVSSPWMSLPFDAPPVPGTALHPNWCSLSDSSTHSAATPPPFSIQLPAARSCTRGGINSWCCTPGTTALQDEFGSSAFQRLEAFFLNWEGKMASNERTIWWE